MNGREAAMIAGGVVAGLAAGIPLGVVLFDKKVRKEYDHAADVMRLAYEKSLASALTDESPVDTEDDLQPLHDIANEAGVAAPADVFTGSLEKDFVPAGQNPYHETVVASNNANSFTLPGEPSHIEYIDPEDYEDEDGREKHVVQMLKAELGLPMVFLDSAHIDDWDIHLGDTIISDYYRLVPDGTSPLYVRNHKLDKDYIVTMEMP